MLLTGALSLKRVGMRSRSPGTMVMWLSCTTGTCAKSSERSEAALQHGEVTCSALTNERTRCNTRQGNAGKLISRLAHERTALRTLRRQCQGTNAAGLTFLECVAGRHRFRREVGRN